MIYEMKNHKKKLQWVLIHCFVVLAAYGLYLRLHFSTDGYSRLMRGFANDGLGMLNNGRYVAYFVEWVLYKLNLEQLRNNGFFTLLFIAFSGMCSATLSNELLNYFELANRKTSKKNEYLVHIGCLFPFVNVYLAEWYFFSECMDFYIPAMMGGCLAAIYTARGFVGRYNKNLIVGLICLMISYNSYQVGLEVYIFFVMLLLWLQCDGCFGKQFCKNLITAALFAMLSMASNLLLTHWMESTGLIGTGRYSGLGPQNIVENAGKILNTWDVTWVYSHYQMPKGIFLAVFVFLSFAVVGFIFIRKEHVWERLAASILVMLGGLLGIYMPHLLTSVVWISNRTMIALFCCFTVLLVMVSYLLCDGGITDRKAGLKTPNSIHWGGWMSAILTLSVAFLLIDVYSIQNIEQECFATNAVEQTISSQISNYIERYEKSTGNTVEYIGFMNDSAPTWHFSFAKHAYNETCQNAYTVSWNRLPCLEYYSGRRYGEIEIPENVSQEYFADQNWDALCPEEEIVFEGNKAYICMY